MTDSDTRNQADSDGDGPRVMAAPAAAGVAFAVV